MKKNHRIHPRKLANDLERFAKKVLTPILVCFMVVLGLSTTLSGSAPAEASRGVPVDYSEFSITQIINNIKVNGWVVEDKDPTDLEVVQENMGNSTIELSQSTLVKKSLPSAYYSDLDFSSFQAWMPYNSVSSRGSDAYRFLHRSDIYFDENGLCRQQTDPEEHFTIKGIDDYVVALGTFYKTPHKCGERFLIVTTTGMFTVTTGDEQANQDTDSHNMFIRHGNKASLLEYVVDVKNLNSSIRKSGSVTSGPVSAIKGTITAIYKIEEG